MANCMSNIADGLGVTIYEVFRIDTDSDDYYRITKEGLEIDVSESSSNVHDWKPAPDQTLLLLIWGQIDVIKLRWKPGYGEAYFVPNLLSYAQFTPMRWYDTAHNKVEYDKGIVFRTEEEAIDATKKVLSIIREIKR